DRGGPVSHREQSLGRAGTAVLDIARLDDQLRIWLDAGPGQGGQIAAPAEHPGADGRLSGEMANPAVTQAVPVLGRDPRPHFIVRPDEGIEAAVSDSGAPLVRDAPLAPPSGRGV